MQFQSKLIDSSTSWYKERHLAYSTLKNICQGTGWACLPNRLTSTDLVIYLMRQGEGWEASKLLTKLLPYRWEVTVESMTRIKVSLGR